MKIGKYFLTALLTAAIALPVLAQDKEYDVKLTIYPQEVKKEEVKKEKQAKKERMSKGNPRRADRKERAGERFENRYDNYGEPVRIENVQGRSENTVKGEEPAYPGEPVRIQRNYPNDPAAPVRPRVSSEPVAQCPEGGCCGKEDKKCDKPCCDKPCGKQGEKPCCADKGACQGQMPCCPMQMQGCPRGGQPYGMCAMGQQGHGMRFMGKAQYREMRRKQLAGFYGDRFYLGTNLMALAVGMPNISAEWRRDESFGVRLSVGGSYMSWYDDDEAIGGFWINPEARWYLGGCKSWYAGPMARFGYIANNSNDHRLSISVGGTFGYMQRVSKKFAVDYNVGVGFSAIGDYDGYYYSPEGATTEWRAAFTPLKVGISFVWLTCNKPYKKK